MMALQVYGIEKEFEGIPVLTGCSFDLAAGEKVGLVGANGSGKSTLMKILAGELTPDGGSVHWVHPDLTRGYLVQQGHLDPDRTLKSQMGPVPADLLARCGVTPAMLAQKAGSLSGGQKVRAALARVLARRPEVLLLDEPTSHLDADGLRWLEALLAGYRGTVLAISHDRAFLDKVASRILEMESGQVRSYPGNYSAYARLKQAELERQMEEYRQYRAEKAHIEAAIRRQRQWSITGANQKIEAGAPMGQYEYNQGQAKSHMQKVKSMEKRLERIRVEKPRDPQRLSLRFGGGGHVGRHLAQASGLGFRYGEGPWLFRSADFFVERGERVALVGPNGSGKTTLLKLLVGDLEPAEGRLHRSPVRTAYLAQELEHLDPRNTVLQEAASGNAAADQPRVRTLLGCLLFSRDEVVKPVAVLSGGEKVRLAIAKILLSDPDLLVLDEPTNGLDLPSRERVEEALESYAGTLLLVSHDRYLLSRLATRVISIQDGRLEPFPGTYDQFLRRHERPAGGDPDERRLLLETRLSQLSALLAAPPEGEGERLTAEFIEVSRELRSMRKSTP